MIQLQAVWTLLPLIPVRTIHRISVECSMSRENKFLFYTHILKMS